MLSMFPELLFLAPFAATLLRIAVGVAFLAMASIQWNRREEIGNAPLPIVGLFGPWWVVISVGVGGIMGLAFIAGYATQLAALLGLALCIKYAILAKTYPRAIPFCRGEYMLLAVMCASLIFTGAGALAFDLPL